MTRSRMQLVFTFATAAAVGLGMYQFNMAVRPLPWPKEAPGYWSGLTILLFDNELMCGLSGDAWFLVPVAYVLSAVACATVMLHAFKRFRSPKRLFTAVAVAAIYIAIVAPLFPEVGALCPQM